MADFCIDCWNKLNNTDYNKKSFIVSKDLDLCEGCGEYKHIIEYEKNIDSPNLFKILLWRIVRKF